MKAQIADKNNSWWKKIYYAFELSTDANINNNFTYYYDYENELFGFCVESANVDNEFLCIFYDRFDAPHFVRYIAKFGIAIMDEIYGSFITRTIRGIAPQNDRDDFTNVILNLNTNNDDPKYFDAVYVKNFLYSAV